MAIASPALDALVARVETALTDSHPEVAAIFGGCLRNSIDTSLDVLPDGTTFLATGDIPAMWLRDSAAQVRPYVPLAIEDETIRGLLRGLIRRTVMYVNLDPYANAFNVAPNGNGHQSDRTAMTPWTWERKWELDSLCYPVMLLRDWWDATRDASVFDEDVHRMLRLSVDTMRTEQHHAARSSYRFWRTEHAYPNDNLSQDGHGAPVGDTGMVWVGFRPSDDACTYNFHVPSNMFAAAVLPHVAQFAEDQFGDVRLARDAEQLASGDHHRNREARRRGPPRLRTRLRLRDRWARRARPDGRRQRPQPPLDPLPRLPRRPMTRRTWPRGHSSSAPRTRSTSPAARPTGVGSPHTPPRHVWPIALSMQALTATDPAEAEALLRDARRRPRPGPA